MLKVSIIAKQKLFSQGLMAILKDSSDIEVIATLQFYKNISGQLSQNTDVLLIELHHQCEEAVKLARSILAELPKVKIIFLSDQDDSPQYLKEVLEAGVSGYMTKNASVDELVYGILKVYHDGLYICTAFALRILAGTEIQDKTKIAKTDHTITEREMDVLKLVAEGLTNKDIALKLHTSVRTIETRRNKLLEKTGTLNTASLIRYCMRNGIIQ